ncbi:MAG: hypothetical protein U0746_03930 [Gemmataceae bacterium]
MIDRLLQVTAMYANRIQHLIPEELPVAAIIPHGFVPCPVAVLSSLTPSQQSAVEAIYRIAQERAQAQLQPDRRAWESRIQFSDN